MYTTNVFFTHTIFRNIHLHFSIHRGWYHSLASMFPCMTIFNLVRLNEQNMWVSYATLRGRTFDLTHWLLLNENPVLRTPETCTINFILDIDRRLNSFLMDRGSLQPHKEPISEYQMFFNPFWIHHNSSTLAFDCPQCHHQ